MHTRWPDPTETVASLRSRADRVKWRVRSRNPSAAQNMFKIPHPGSWSLGLRQVRRVVIFVVGMTVLLIGIVLIFTPGPAVVVVPAGLAILGIEFAWARRWLVRARAMFETTFTRRHATAPVRLPERKARE